MKIAAFIEQTKGNSYRAFSTSPAEVEADGTTREQAIDRLRETLQQRLAQLEVVEVDVAAKVEPHPWLTIAGSWKDRPGMDEFEQAVRDYRRQVDEDESRP